MTRPRGVAKGISHRRSAARHPVAGTRLACQSPPRVGVPARAWHRCAGPGPRETSVTTPYSDERAISMDEASRQLELAAHDAQVAFDCIALGNLDRAHTNALTARAAVDAAETMLRAALSGAGLVLDTGADGADEAVDAQPDEAFEAFGPGADEVFDAGAPDARLDRKSTRLNSSHLG